MCSHKYTIELSEHANQDLADIVRYTAKTWGQSQREKYEVVLEKGFQMIAENPNIGRYKQAYNAYFLNIGSHIVI
jgi:plasmid stabilization system protein ParE